MDCPTCNRPMTPLFYTCVCDHCEGKAPPKEVGKGFIVRRNQALPAQEYVFKTRIHAYRYRAAKGLDDFPIVRVRAPVAFNWRESTGKLKHVVTADKLVTIYPDHRFPEGAHRAYVAE